MPTAELSASGTVQLWRARLGLELLPGSLPGSFIPSAGAHMFDGPVSLLCLTQEDLSFTRELRELPEQFFAYVSVEQETFFWLSNKKLCQNMCSEQSRRASHRPLSYF